MLAVRSRTFRAAFTAAAVAATAASRRQLHRASSILLAELKQAQQQQQQQQQQPQQQRGGGKQTTKNRRRRRRRLDVAIVGLANAGKSQLLNALTGVPVAAVSRKRHTTRNANLLGARTVVDDDDNTETQILFIDTPGFIRKSDERVSGDLQVTSRANMVDFTIVVVDAAARRTDPVKATLVQLMLQARAATGRVEMADPDDDEDSYDDDDDAFDDEDFDDDEVFDDKDEKDGNERRVNMNEDKYLNEVDEEQDGYMPHQNFAICCNKVDLVSPKSKLLDMGMEIADMAVQCLQYQDLTNPNTQPVKELDHKTLHQTMPTFFYTNARKNEGVDELLKYLVRKATPSKHFEVQPGLPSAMTPQERATEIIREKIYRCLHKEVPYTIQQETRTFKVGKMKNGEVVAVIFQDLIVQTKSHQQLVRGTGFRTIKTIEETATRDIQRAFGCKVTVQLNVKLKKSKQRRWSI